ncbi:class I tRNA ligase family protein, partial [Devosia sp.]|uniref:isoleucine--tRNA ligase n=1 Tax=Devosia sp. TaxID=1871048 RepID=UPI001AD1750A
MTDTAASATEKDYSATLFLPETEFPMRAGLPDREPIWLKRWQDMDIYERQREQAKDRPLFTLHDGPPYANGNIHIGHALNKTLKDLVSRSMQMLGHNAAYIPGWDCHGLPIEWKIEEQYRAKGKDKNEVPVVEFRQECRSFAESWVDIQREEFKRLGILGEWDNPYLTMSFDAEAQIARELMKVSMSGQLYRGSKPVMWSVVERTALAEAEIEYADYESDTIWVKFPVAGPVATHRLPTNELGAGPAFGRSVSYDRDGSEPEVDSYNGVSVVIWTTTPWTIPANRAISFSSKISYGLYEVLEAPADNWAKAGDRYVLADKLAPEVFAKAKIAEGNYRSLGAVRPEEILACFHPLHGLAGGYNFQVPLLDGEHVTDDAGTGFVHTAPSHGLDDFEIWMNSTRALQARGIDPSIPTPVGDDGFYTKDAPGFDGGRVIDDNGKKGDANQRVISALAERGAMVARGRVKHQYPHSWRSKKPVIYRNTPQWFVYMDKAIEGAEGDTLRVRALNAIDKTKFYPAAGQNRLRAMIADRPDWVLSRQRAWGVPITVFVHKETAEILKDELVNHRIAQSFEEEGADAW